MEQRDSLAIVTGAKGALGKAYLEELGKLPDIRRVGIVRSDVDTSEKIQGVEYISGVDLTNQKIVEQTVAAMTLSTADKIFLIHPVGKFRFDATPSAIVSDKDIDHDIYASNVSSLTNIAIPLIERKPHDTPLIINCFGSVSDKYNVPFWNHYTASKNMLRAFLTSLGESFHETAHVRSLFINVTTTQTGNEQSLRPYGDTKYWLKPEAIVTQSLPHILADDAVQYQEMDIVNPKPNFSPDHYYRDLAALRAKWLEEMNGNG